MSFHKFNEHRMVMVIAWWLTLSNAGASHNMTVNKFTDRVHGMTTTNTSLKSKLIIDRRD